MSSSELAGQPSPVFGPRYPYPFDGKTVLMEFASRFADEFNELARAQLRQEHGAERAGQWKDLVVTSAWPTTKAQIPRIAVLRVGSVPQPTGLDVEYHEQRVQIGQNKFKLRRWAGQVVTDTLEVAICTINERLRDDLFLWFQQYILDASLWALPQLREAGFYELQCTNAVDDQVDYQGTATQPGFEFYVARLNYRATYDLTLFTDVDELKTVFVWEGLDAGAYQIAGAAGKVDPNSPIVPPNSVFQ